MPGGIPFYKRMGLGKYHTWKHGHPNSPKRPCLIRTFWHVVSDRVLSSPFHQPPRGAFSKHPYIDTNGCCVVAAAKNMRRSDTAAVPFPIVFEGAILHVYVYLQSGSMRHKMKALCETHKTAYILQYVYITCPLHTQRPRSPHSLEIPRLKHGLAGPGAQIMAGSTDGGDLCTWSPGRTKHQPMPKTQYKIRRYWCRKSLINAVVAWA
jgi:hypothetical protein